MQKDINTSLSEIVKKLNEILFNTSDEKFINKLSKEIKQRGEIEFTNYKRIQRNPEIIKDLFDSKERLSKIYKFLKTIQDIDSKKISVLNYFTETEIKNYNNVVFDVFDENQYKTFKNVFRKAHNQYSLLLSVEDIALLSSSNLIRVDTNYQRQSKYKVDKVTNQVLKTIYVNYSRVDEICQLIIDNKYYFDELKINLMNETDSKLVYSEEDLSLSWDGDMVVPDGNHRRLACVKAYEAHPELREQFKNQKFNISLTYLTPRELKTLISQTWNTEPIAKRQKEMMKQKKARDIFDEILRSNDIEQIFLDKLTNTRNGFVSNKKIFIEDYLVQKIEECYNSETIKLKVEVKRIADWLVEFFNYVIEIWIDDIENYNDVIKMSWKFHPTIICGLTEISKYLFDKLEYNNYNWKQKTVDILDSIDFKTPIFDETKNRNEIFYKNQIIVISNFFKERCK